MAPHQDQNGLGIAATSGVPDRARDSQKQENFEEDGDRMMEIERQYFHDMAGLESVGQVLRDMHVQTIEVWIDETRRQAAAGRKEIIAGSPPDRQGLAAVG